MMNFNKMKKANVFHNGFAISFVNISIVIRFNHRVKTVEYLILPTISTFFFHNKKSPIVSGIIDFESVRFGSTEIDFTKLYRDFLSVDVNLYNAYQEGYNSIRPLIDLENVLPFYRFTDAINSIGWCKRRGIEKNALFLEGNLARLKKWLL
ncbi:hypothetical protein LSPCS325_34450 [Lysinibacillus sp. CTST325]